MKQIFTCSLFLSLGVCIAQPTITNSWVPTPGISYRAVSYDGDFGLSEGSSGASQTWDFTNWDTLSSQTATYINPASAPGSSSFPGSTDVLNSLSVGGNSTYLFNKINGNIYSLIGTSQPISNYIINYGVDPQEIYHFPITYNSSFTDNMRATGSYSSGGNTGTLKRKGNETVTADAYGTLTTAAGTFTNVMRVKTVQDLQDTIITGGQTVIYTYHYETYAWLSAAYRGIVLASITHGTTNGLPQDYGNYAKVLSNGIADELLESSLTVYPVPTSGNTTISFTLSSNTDVEVTVLNTLGEAIHSLPATHFNEGEHTLSLPATTWANGTYFIQVKTNEGSLTKKLIVQQ